MILSSSVAVASAQSISCAQNYHTNLLKILLQLSARIIRGSIGVQGLGGPENSFKSGGSGTPWNLDSSLPENARASKGRKSTRDEAYSTRRKRPSMRTRFAVLNCEDFMQASLRPDKGHKPGLKYTGQLSTHMPSD